MSGTAVDAVALSARLTAGRAAFNRGEFFVAHELWEQAWNQLRGDSDPENRAVRLRVQGLIQIAAGLHHLQSDRRRPAATLLRRGETKLTPRAETATGQQPLVNHPAWLAQPWSEADIAQLKRGALRCAEQLNGPGTQTPDPSSLRL